MIQSMTGYGKAYCEIKNKKIGGFSGKAAQVVLPNKVILGIIRASLPV